MESNKSTTPIPIIEFFEREMARISLSCSVLADFKHVASSTVQKYTLHLAAFLTRRLRNTQHRRKGDEKLFPLRNLRRYYLWLKCKSLAEEMVRGGKQNQQLTLRLVRLLMRNFGSRTRTLLGSRASISPLMTSAVSCDSSFVKEDNPSVSFGSIMYMASSPP